MDKPRPDSLFAAGKAKWLLKNIDKLSEEERALLLAIAELEKDTGRQVSAEEQQALDKLADKLGGFNPTDIADAVNQMVTAETKRHPVDEWPSAIHKIIVKKKHD